MIMKLIRGSTSVFYLMEEVLVDNIFNSFDFGLFVCRSRRVGAARLSRLELVVLRLEVFRVDVWGRVAVQKLPL